MSSLPPTNITGELRDWYFDNTLLCYVGEQWNSKIAANGSMFRIYSYHIHEVIDYADYKIIVTKRGGRYILWKDKEHRRIND